MNSKEIEVPVWWKNGGMIYNRDCLPPDHPEQTYNYIKNKLGLAPENYGVYHPLMEKRKDLLEKTKEELVALIIDMESIKK